MRSNINWMIYHGKQAEKYLYDDQLFVLSNIRSMIEQMTEFILRSENLRPLFPLPVDEKINSLFEAGFIEEQHRSILDEIRLYGNKSVHAVYKLLNLNVSHEGDIEVDEESRAVVLNKAKSLIIDAVESFIKKFHRFTLNI